MSSWVHKQTLFIILFPNSYFTLIVFVSVLKLNFVFCREAMGVVLHKDSKWYQQWKDFKDNNVVFNSEDYLSFSALLGSHQLTVTNVTLVITELIADKLIGSHTDLINVGLMPSLQSASLSRCAT